MGNIIGHLIGAFACIFIGIWWMYSVFKRRILQKPGTRYIASASFLSSFRGKEYNIEVYIKIFAPLLEVIQETHVVEGQIEIRTVGGWQHMSIYLVFVFHAVVDLLQYKKIMPIDGLEYFTMSISFWWYGLIFYFHTKRDVTTPLEIVIHLMGIVWCFATAASVLWEARSSEPFLPSYSRSYFALGLGTWFLHTPFILYDGTGNYFNPQVNPNWDQQLPENVQLVATMFSGHLIVNGIFSLLLYSLVKFMYRSQTKYYSKKFDSNEEKHPLLNE